MFRFDIKRRYVLLLKAYFDDSGTHSTSKVVCWAGFMAAEEEWAPFEQEWAALLKREGLKSFHMFDVHNAVGQCEGWNRARSDMVIHDFRQVICARDVLGIASVVRTDDWNEVIGADEWLTKRLVSPSQLALEHVIQQAVHWAQRRAEVGVDPEKVAMFFDLRQEDVVAGLDAAALYREDHPWRQWFNGAAFVNMRDTLPLQAADMLAWETYRLETSRQRKGSEPELRAHLHAMLRDLPIHGQYYDKDALRDLAGQIIRREQLDLMKPQGSDPSKGWLTTLEKDKLYRIWDTLGESMPHRWFELATSTLNESDRNAARAEFLSQLEAFKYLRERSQPPQTETETGQV
jgi:hypothetical protein